MIDKTHDVIIDRIHDAQDTRGQDGVIIDKTHDAQDAVIIALALRDTRFT